VGKQVDVERAPPVGVGGVETHAPGADTGVGKEDVDGAKLPLGGRDRLPQVALLGDVAAERNRPARAEVRDRRGRGLAVDVDDHHPRASGNGRGC